MGIKNLFQIIVKNPISTYNDKPLGALARETTLAKLRGIRVCVDASGMIYQSILAMKHMSALSDSQGRTTAHINTIFNKVIQFKTSGIQQIWIFDSPDPNPIKEEELKKRRAKAYASTDPKVQFRMSGEHVDDIKNLLNFMGVPWVQAPPGIEAEQYGAWMTKGAYTTRFCQYMVSGDSDVLGFGGNLLRPYSKKSASGKSSRTVYQIFELDTVLEETGLSYLDFLKMGVFMGTDFNAKPRGPSVKTIMQAIKDDKLTLTPELQKVIDYFSSTPQYDPNDLITQFPTIDIEGLVKFLKERDFKEERVRQSIDKFVKAKTK